MRSSSSTAFAISGCAWSSSSRSISRCPRAIVTGVRSSCDTSCRSCSWWSSSAARSAATRSVSLSATCRRLACHTIARNMPDISGTSNSSPHSSDPSNASLRITAPVVAATAPRMIAVALRPHTRKPYRIVRLTQMKWNGIVSQFGVSSIAMRLITANPTHATSIFLELSQSVTDIAHRFDGSLRAKLLPQPADRYVHDVRARIEVVSPHLGEQLLSTAHLAGVLQHEVEKPELAVRELARPRAETSLALGQVEEQRPGLEQRVLHGRLPPPQLHANPREQLAQRERLDELVVRAELEAAQLGLEIAARGQDQHRQGGLALPQLAKQVEPVHTR